MNALTGYNIPVDVSKCSDKANIFYIVMEKFHF